jgi:tetratricopeptide (TPR) repeat protein
VTVLTLPTRRPRAIGILAAALLIAAGSTLAGLSGLGVATAPSKNLDPLSGAAGGTGGTVAVPIPGAGSAAAPIGTIGQLDHNIRAWTANLAANPLDFISATNLAALYQARARLTADLADHERALAAARTAIGIAPTQPSARILEASILFSLHDFTGARAAADGLVREDPSQLAALAIRADAALELGDLTAARADLATLAAATSGPALDIRLARLAAVTGDLSGALELAGTARETAFAEGGDVAFYEFALGEYARLAGDAATARDGYEAALALRAADVGAMLGLGRLQAYEGDLDGAVETLVEATLIAPTPEAEALLGDLLTLRAADPARTAAQRALDEAEAAAAYGTVRLTRALSAEAGSVYDRQLILFELDHDTPTAVTLDAARAALFARPDAQGHDLLAWALHRLGRHDEAWAESVAARATGAADARTLFHAGMIALARGDADVATRLLARAAALGPGLDPIERAALNRALTGVDAESVLPG